MRTDVRNSNPSSTIELATAVSRRVDQWASRPRGPRCLAHKPRSGLDKEAAHQSQHLRAIGLHWEISHSERFGVGPNRQSPAKNRWNIAPKQRLRLGLIGPGTKLKGMFVRGGPTAQSPQLNINPAAMRVETKSRALPSNSRQRPEAFGNPLEKWVQGLPWSGEFEGAEGPLVFTGGFSPPQPRIDEHIGDIGCQVEQNIRRRRHQRHALHNRIIAIEDAVDDQFAKAWN